MNIAPISVFKQNLYKPFKKETPLFRGQIESKNDVFVAKKPLSKYYSKPLSEIVKEAEEYIMNTPIITYRGLNKIVQKYSDTKVKRFSPKCSPNKKSVAQFSQELYYEKSDKGIDEKISNQTIYINIPIKQNKAVRAELLGSFIHEAVHMFQFETKVKVFGGSSTKKYYQNIKSFEDSKKITTAVKQLYYGYSKFEQNIFTLTENFLNFLLNLCLDVDFMQSYVNLENFDKFLKKGHNMDLADIAKLLIEDTYYETGDNIINALGKDAIVEYAKEKISKELEAYSAENEVMQKHSPNKTRKMEAKFTVEVYQKLLDIVNNLKLERTN